MIPGSQPSLVFVKSLHFLLTLLYCIVNVYEYEYVCSYYNYIKVWTIVNELVLNAFTICIHSFLILQHVEISFKGPYPPSPNKPSTLSPYHPTKELLSNIRILRDQIANQLQNNQHPGESAMLFGQNRLANQSI